MSLLVLTAHDVANVSADWSTDDLQSLMARVFFTLSHPAPDATIAAPHRTAIDMPSHRALFMPARISGIGTTVKVVSVPTKSGDTRGIPGSTLVLDEGTGSVRALVNARSLTALRTAAGSVLATVLLRPPATARFERLVAFGAGAQIEAHVTQLAAAYSSLAHITIVNRTVNERLNSLLAGLRSKHPTLHFAALSGVQDRAAVEAAVRRADCICCATSSTAPLFPDDWVRSGAHVILVGSYKPEMAEVDTALVHRARVLVDSRSACAVEAGELIAAGVPAEGMVEVGELVRHVPTHDGGWAWEADSAKVAEVLTACDVTMFKSVGVGAQDVAIAAAAVDRALQMGVGTAVPVYDDVPRVP
ncbi:NAD-P-binding protein [Gloeopeniophorella convolvens]|nr:NAD-P-binding protein [Gloeopeniophorella convolvens]